MAVYIFNLLAGCVRTGVDYAQGYRAQALKSFSQPVKFVFMELPNKSDIYFYEYAGISVGQMLSMHLFLADGHSMEVSANTEEKLAELEHVLRYTDVERLDTEIRLLRDGHMIASILLNKRKEYFYAIHYYSEGTRLIRTEFYTDRISYANYYMTAEGDGGLYAKLVRREFYNIDGSVAYEQICEGDREWYLFPDGRRYNKAWLVADFFKKLDLSHRDIVLMDYGAMYNQMYNQFYPVFEFGKSARIMTFFHSDHYFEKGENPSRINLNYEYYYWFKHACQIDTMVVSTQEQRIRLVNKLKEFGCGVPRSEVIPVSGLSKLCFPERERKRYSLISVSRVTPQKKVDWIVKSIIKAHRRNPNIFIDIYGEDEYGYRERLQDIVTANDAQSYIHFKGYMDVKEIYKEYEVYLSASLGETLGLTLMEAAGSGLAMIGLDVRYGNRQFIQSEKNGYLIPYDRKHIENDDSELIDVMADKIVEIFEDQNRLEQFHRASYEIAKDFSDEVIGEKWRKLFS